MMTKGKWCVQCGTPVDLRRDFRLAGSFCLKLGVKNPEYAFVHRKCNDALMNDVKKPLFIEQTVVGQNE